MFDPFLEGSVPARKRPYSLLFLSPPIKHSQDPVVQFLAPPSPPFFNQDRRFPLADRIGRNPLRSLLRARMLRPSSPFVPVFSPRRILPLS